MMRGIVICLILACVFSAPAFGQFPGVSDFLIEKGKEYYEYGDLHSALQEFKKALLTAPEHEEALKYIGIIEEELRLAEEELAEKKRLAEKILEEDAEEIYITKEIARNKALMQALDAAQEEIDKEMKEEKEEEERDTEKEIEAQIKKEIEKEISEEILQESPEPEIVGIMVEEIDAAAEDAVEVATEAIETVAEVAKEAIETVAEVEEAAEAVEPVVAVEAPEPETKEEAVIERPAEKTFDTLFKEAEAFEGLDEEYEYGEEAPANISGEYTVSLGSTSEDSLIWKDANGDYNEANWRRINEDFGINTYDTRVFDRLRVDINTNNEEGFNLYSNITIDPWSFIGKTDEVNISNTAGEQAKIQLKYWEANNSIINETYLTMSNGLDLTISEQKVKDGVVPSMVVTNTNNAQLTVPELEINRELWPVRELWMDYNKEDKFQFRFFPVAYQDQALSSDDPLQLSNHMIYWEESPWLDRWQPGILNTGRNPDDFFRGEWEDDLSYFTRDSNMTRLTSLRGWSLKSNFWENLSIETTMASPKGLWQDYDAYDNIEGATRVKFTPEENLELGLTSTFRYGLEESKSDAENKVIGGDISYQFAPDFSVKGQVAYSHDEQDLSREPYNTRKTGNAYIFELKKGKLQEERPERWGAEKEDEEYLEELTVEDMEPFDYALRLNWTHMDKGFYPALATYRLTRKDTFWGRHLHFTEPYQEYYMGLTYPSVTWDDIRAFRIGDSVDIDRDVAGLRLEKAFLDGDLEALLDCRNAHEASGGKYIETVSRLETTWQASEKLLVKFLGLYHDLPNTKSEKDPFVYDEDTNEFKDNEDIEAGKDPSLHTVSTGFKYDFFDWLSLDFIYEYTNDCTLAMDDYPRKLLSETNFSSYTENGLNWRRSDAYLYDQFLFPAPPYPWFGIYKAGLEIEPMEDLNLRLEFTKNDYKFAGQIDDNINHLGLYANYDITDKISLRFDYTYAKCYDIQRRDEGLDYQAHHNVFVNLDYKLDDKGIFSLQFGEAAVLPYTTAFTTSPYPGYLPTVDTAHIVRAYFTRKF